jgi:hypothetical protein
VRMVFEHAHEYPSQWKAIESIAGTFAAKPMDRPASLEESVRGVRRSLASEPPAPLAPRTLELYESLLRLHVLPGRITTAGVRRWHAGLTAAGSTSMPAKAYRLVRAILATAVEDEFIARNPCVIKGSPGVEHTPERPTAGDAGIGHRRSDRAALPSSRPDGRPSRRCVKVSCSVCGGSISTFSTRRYVSRARHRPFGKVASSSRRRSRARVLAPSRCRRR